ncbi:ATP-dependent protease La type I [Helicobacter bizzozeronii CIII-1]|uniref:Lon protease n=1 Tax=Helicobacter bizzozeronii (strain CIII-1) TaxID=1002804 RepID=F8KR88_HELBC|nr:endopeptidase La [Helicobacter bizzozeronii]CCB79262.1 ATP-dependent protease La type I [Helicobacter bizzozeronii CIII-1]
MTEKFPSIVPVIVEEEAFMYPFMIAPIFINSEANIKAANKASKEKNDLIFVSCAKNGDRVGEDKFYDVGVIGSIVRKVVLPDNRMKILFQGICKGKVLAIESHDPLEAMVDVITYREYDTDKINAIIEILKEKVANLANISQFFPPDLLKAVDDNSDPNRIVDLVASALRLKKDQSYKLFANDNTEERLLDLIDLVMEEIKTQKLQKEIKSKVHSKMEQVNKEYFLKEQLKQIQKELGIDKQRDEEIQEYTKKLQEIEPFITKEIHKEIKKQIDRLSRIHQDSSDVGILQNYIEWVLDIPFGQYSQKKLSIKDVEKQLDLDHYSLEKPKERIVEYFATMELLRLRQQESKESKGTILCFYGPPGVGKTSLANSIARAMERPLIRIALGGLEDVNELRGHRRTYLGSMPGRIVQGLIEAKKMDCVMVLDEIDKVDKSMRGDPASALLEILDPEQNTNFRDYYTNFNIDLSKIIFIATANDIATIPAPLRDRMEFIAVSSYTPQEKEQIALNYLIPQELKKHALSPSEVVLSLESVRLLIEKYTREAGVRGLRRAIAAIMRKCAKKILQANEDKPQSKRGRKRKIVIEPTNIPDFLDKIVFEIDPIDKEDAVGIVNGLAWTSVGGDVLKIEAIKIKGKGNLKLTGSLGEVMKESAYIAHSVVKTLLDDEVLIPKKKKTKEKENRIYNLYDIHLHVPEGATPKDGPSAGITMATSIASILCDRKVRADVAMTGELTLSGRVLPIGGLKEKLIASFKAGIKIALIPEKNYTKDLKDIPQEVQDNMEIKAVQTIQDVLNVALVNH